MTDRCCADCRFSHEQLQSTGLTLIFCRHSPPACVPTFAAEPPSVRHPNGRQMQVMRSLWPAMAQDDWCYRFEARTLPNH